MPVIIQSKKTASELETVRSDIVASEARSSDALDAHKSAYASKVAEIESSASALTARLSAQETKQEADKVATKAEHDARVASVDATFSEFSTNFAAHVANFDAEKTFRDAQKADLEAGIADAKAEASTAVADVDSKFEAEKARVATREAAVDASFTAVDSKIDTEKATLQASIDALASSTSGASGALTSRVDELETKVGTDLTATINTALSDGVVQATLDGFLAKDTELAGALTTALNERTSADDAIKAKFDLLVAKLFEGLTFEGVTQAELSFTSPVPSSYTINFPDGSQQVVASADEVDFSGWTFGASHPETVRRAVIYGDVLYLIGAWNNDTDGLTTYWIKIKMATGENSTVSLGYSVNYANFDPANESTERAQISTRKFSKGGIEYPGSVDDF